MTTPVARPSCSPTIETLQSRLRTDGYAVARGHVDAGLIGDLGVETNALLGRFAAGDRPDDFWCYEDGSTDRPMLYRVHNLEKQGAAGCADLFRDAVLHDLASALIGPVRATVCAMVVKTPGVAGVPWHRDRIDVAPGTAINLSVFLDRAAVENGCFEAVPGSHLLADDADVPRTHDLGPRMAVPAEPGDVLVHDVRLVHGSGDNPSGELRRSIIIEFTSQAG
ncbi:MAG: phytanoyl-CoA dioxygenase family protein [Pseudonocardiaceae bacterium]